MEKSYREEVDEQTYRMARKRHMILMLLIYAGCVVVTAGIFVLIVYGYVNRKYDAFETVRSAERADSNTVQYMSYDDKLLKYSRDGASAIDATGNAAWNGSYDMENPKADICGKYAVIADIDGKEAYVYNGSDSGTLIETTQNIIQARVAKQGVVALLLEDADSNVINLYNPYELTDTLIAEIPTNVTDGFPVDFALSPDGKSVVAAYVCVTSGIVESKVAFYNFSKVGQDRDCLVSGETYKDTIISKVEFLSDDTVCIFSDNGYAVWDNLKQPSKVCGNTFEEEIRSTFYTDGYVGFVFDNYDSDTAYTMQVFDVSGKEVLNRSIDFDYDNIKMSGKEIILYSRQGCMIVRINGVVKLNCSMDQAVEGIFAAKKANHYYLLESSRLEEVKLTKQKD